MEGESGNDAVKADEGNAIVVTREDLFLSDDVHGESESECAARRALRLQVELQARRGTGASIAGRAWRGI